MAKINLSEKIELILGIFSQCKTDYIWYASQMEVEENKEELDKVRKSVHRDNGL